MKYQGIVLLLLLSVVCGLRAMDKGVEADAAGAVAERDPTQCIVERSSVAAGAARSLERAASAPAGGAVVPKTVAAAQVHLARSLGGPRAVPRLNIARSSLLSSESAQLHALIQLTGGVRRGVEGLQQTLNAMAAEDVRHHRVLEHLVATMLAAQYRGQESSDAAQ